VIAALVIETAKGSFLRLHKNGFEPLNL
jgi:hypothetical protein